MDPITIKIPHTRRAPFPSSGTAVDLAAQRGECERAQLWLRHDVAEMAGVRVAFDDLYVAGTGPQNCSDTPWGVCWTGCPV